MLEFEIDDLAPSYIHYLVFIFGVTFWYLKHFPYEIN